MFLAYLVLAAFLAQAAPPPGIGDTVNKAATAVATDLAKAMAGIGMLALVVTGLSLIWNIGGNNFGKMIRGNLAQIFAGIAICLSAAGIIAFITASVAAPAAGG